MNEFRCKVGDWEAVEDRMPPSPKARLRVTGSAVCPTPGHVIRVRRREPQGTVADDLQLELTAERPSRPVLQPLAEVRFEYRDEVTPGRYRTITLFPEGGTKKIEVVH